MIMSKLRKALDKAKEAREGLVEDIVIDDKISSPLRTSPIKKQEKPFEKINPTYHHTAIKQIDFDNLENNKIISICHGNAVADQLKILRTQILSQLKKLQGNSLLITSANPGEGRTVTAINLAITLSQQIDGTVLLVDADLRKPSIHTLLGFDAENGLSDYLRGKAQIADLLVNPGMHRLVVLPGGKAIPNSSEHLGSPRMEALINELKERYTDRFIIFDSPPLLASADSLVLSRFIDGILMVVEAEKTSKEDLKRAMELLRDKPVIGTVLNKIKQ
jgi:non-specific protein-tyrosine kinase